MSGGALHRPLPAAVSRSKVQTAAALLLSTALALCVARHFASRWAGEGSTRPAAAAGGWVRRQQAAPDPKARITCTRPGAAAALASGSWQELEEERCDPSTPRLASCTAKLGHQWVWDRQVCSAHQYGAQDLRGLLAGKSVAILGDSHGRHLYTWLVRMLDGTFAKTIEDAGKFWADATWHGASVTGAAAPQPAADLHISLRWLTTLPPITEDVRKLQQLGAFPDVVFLSGGNWYHVEKRSMEQFQADLAELETAVADADAAAQQAGKHVLWLLLTIPPRVHGRSWVSTWHTPPRLVPEWNAALRNSALLHPRGPALLLDINALAESCLVWCSADGIHSNAAVYALSIQLMANLLALPPGSAAPAAPQ